MLNFRLLLSSPGGTTNRTAVIVSGVRRSRQTVARRELQKRAKQEYLKNIYEVSQLDSHSQP